MLHASRALLRDTTRSRHQCNRVVAMLSHSAPRSLVANQQQHRRAPAPARAAPLSVHRTPVRHLAARSSSEKSWGELAAEAGQLAKEAASKLGESLKSGVSKALEKVAPQEKAPVEERHRPGEAPLYRQPGEEGSLGGLPSLGGLMGGLLGQAIGGAVQQLAKEVAKTAQDTNEVYREAVHRIETSQRLRSRMGKVTVGPSMSQSSSTSSINGVTSKRIVLLAPVYGEEGRGAATAQISYTQGPQGQSSSQIVVQLPGGGVVEVEGGSGGGGSAQGVAGRTIDVDYTEVK